MEIKEQVIKKLHPHPLGHLSFYVSGVVIFILSFFLWWPLFIVGILTFVLGEVSRRAETFYVLESGVAREYKLLSTSRKFAEYGKIQNIEVSQSILQKMLGIGTVHLDTAGADKKEVSFHGIADPYGIEHIIREKMKLM